MSADAIAAPLPGEAEPPADVSGSTPIAPKGKPVPGRPWVVRDERTGVFKATSPAGSDPTVAVDVASFEAGIATSYPHASPALRLMAVRCFAAFRRLERSAETSALRPGGRLPRALAAAADWMDKAIRILESLEATNTGKRRGAQHNPRAALEELQRQAAARRQA
jgi:hypothetical protein